jgi:MYXO-CTERM domain-containing protein
MKNKFLLATAVATAMVGAANASTVLYTNAWDGTSNLWASQNDTAQYGNFATAYGFFSSGQQTWSVTDIHFVGGYFNGNPAPVAGFTVSFFGDNGSNAPGGYLGGTYVAAGSFTETALGGDLYHYDMNVNPVIVSGDAWVSIVPDIAFPPQWGWGQGVDTDPSHNGWQVFFGSPSRLASSLNLEITGDVVPAPGAVALLGLAGLCGRRRRA